jgi:hypothetical protein
MTALDQYGITAALPTGWEGRIFKRIPAPAPAGAGQTMAVGEQTNAVMHIANFALPVDVEDYGGHAVEAMTNLDLLIAMAEFSPASANTALFAAQGLPQLRARDFSPSTLQRGIQGQSAVQQWFTAAGRPFCLYVVLGSHGRRLRTVPVINDVLGGITIV